MHLILDDKLRIIKHKLHTVDWIGELNSNDVNTNFDHSVQITKEKMDEVAPEKLVRISGKRWFVEAWMTIGIEESTKKCKELYKKTLQKDASPGTIRIYKDYRNAFNKLKRNTKKNYYNERCLALKNNTKKLWELINKTIGKKKITGSIIPYITIDGIKTYSLDRIANAFGTFYANLGSNLANQISPGTTKSTIT